MNYWSKLWRVELLGFVALVVFSFGYGVYATIELNPVDNPNLTKFDWFFMYFGFTFLFGLLPVVIYGAPLLALHLSKPKFNLVYVALASVIPGIVFQSSEAFLGKMFLIAGPTVALMMYGLTKLWPALRRIDH